MNVHVKNLADLEAKVIRNKEKRTIQIYLDVNYRSFYVDLLTIFHTGFTKPKSVQLHSKKVHCFFFFLSDGLTYDIFKSTIAY